MSRIWESFLTSVVVIFCIPNNRHILSSVCQVHWTCPQGYGVAIVSMLSLPNKLLNPHLFSLNSLPPSLSILTAAARSLNSLISAVASLSLPPGCPQSFSRWLIIFLKCRIIMYLLWLKHFSESQLSQEFELFGMACIAFSSFFFF